jgi:hypothetical protein
MKISAWHKRQGDTVEWFNALDTYDKIFSSKVFTYTQKDPYLPIDRSMVKFGGTGYNNSKELRWGIEESTPDYSVYPDFPHALGFSTRGCIRSCQWCIVPKKEGGFCFVQSIESMTQERKSIVLMDNNFLAYNRHAEELESCIRRGVRVDFNQGLDARLVDEGNASLLARLTWIKYIRFSCDTPEMRVAVANAVGLIRKHGYRGAPYCNVLVNDVGEAHETCVFLRSIGVDPFAQAYIDYSGEDKRTKEQKRFCRWVNHKAIFKTVKYEEYK